ncbi:trafficking protein particle complex II-specific subunit 120 homolog isoform X2 [Amborella trichopoda]|uniref:trafficking protein particle complex II-specific subunit 120 homolog isoform X2 n=1 Tax=Amborella trichopoda TaxID=13333 RepID=UPI0005D34587|nr:trafficking protein particle complex II-specific subunit 120 homolog isoform X2 [Amborella trichopoda]|eukprot:XP_011625069.1 trafficking protein particle complex II-specific subunit 120 homolog isoform X2 [Amborella trichopoda]
MEPDVSIESGCMIRIAVLPVGDMPRSNMRDYVSMLLRLNKIELSSISSFYTEHQKSPFAHQPWENGSLRFKFLVGGAQPSAWEDFQSNRKILGVIGLCHCPSSPDLGAVYEQFQGIRKAYSSALVEKCFAFCPSDSQLEDGGKKGNNLILFPPADRQTQEFHIQTMMQDLAAALLMEFEKYVLRAESAGTILKTPLDSQTSLGSEEVIKAKKRRLGRAQKTIGDYCLLAGSPVDANDHYSTAIELARLTGDVFWHAGALEGTVCALLLDRMGQKDQILEEAKYRYYDVIQLYRRSFIQDNAQRVPTVSFELQAALKLARFLCRRELAKEVVDLLMSAADGAKSLIDASDRLVLYVEIARLFGNLGYERKAAFFSRQVAQLYLQQDNCWAAISALQVLAMTSKAYRVQSKGTNARSHSFPNELRLSHLEGGKLNSQSIVSLFECQWSTLQMVVLREILLSAVRAGDPLAAWSAAARLLRSYYPLITPAGQSGLASALSNSAERLPSGTRCADPAVPFVRLHSFPFYPSQMDIIKRNSGKEEWWTGSIPSGPFIYTPFSKGDPNESHKQDLIWIVGEPVQVLVELANPCGFDLTVDSIYLSVYSNNFNAFPVSVCLPPNTSKVISLSGIPTSVGPLTIPGCIVHCFGVITEHLFRDVDNLLIGAAQGLVLSDPFRSCGSTKIKNVLVPNINVVPPLPLLVSHVVGGDSAAILYEGEIRDVWVCLANAGSTPVEQAHISLSGKNQDSVISIGSEILKSALPLKPGAEVMIPVTIKAWQLGLVDSENSTNKNLTGIIGRTSKEGSSPMLVIHYAGPSQYQEEVQTIEPILPPGRRVVVPLHVCVLQGLSFVRARLLSMEIPAHIRETLPIPVYTDEAVSDEVPVNETKADCLVKIDPYRGSWGLRLLELELSNPTDVVFEISVSVQMEDPTTSDGETSDFHYPKTRIDREYSARVLIPLEHFKLPVFDRSFLPKETKRVESSYGKHSNFTERHSKAELNASIKNLTSRIKVRWQSGRNSSGELNIKDAVQAALQTTIMDILLPDPLTFGFRLSRNKFSTGPLDAQQNARSHGRHHSGEDGRTKVLNCSILAHEMTPMEVLVRNNTKELVKMSLSITCKDVAGDNCFDGDKATVLWAGVLSGIRVDVPPLQEITHSFVMYFLVPGEYTLMGSAVIDDASDFLRDRARTDSSNEPIFCSGPPFRLHVLGTA